MEAHVPDPQPEKTAPGQNRVGTRDGKKEGEEERGAPPLLRDLSPYGTGKVVGPHAHSLPKSPEKWVTGGGRGTSWGTPGAGPKGGRCRSDHLGNGVEDPDGAMAEEVAVALVVPPVGAPHFA